MSDPVDLPPTDEPATPEPTTPEPVNPGPPTLPPDPDWPTGKRPELEISGTTRTNLMQRHRRIR